MPRPYLQKSTAELHALFAENQNDVAVLRWLKRELECRKRLQARALLQQVCLRLDSLDQSPMLPPDSLKRAVLEPAPASCLWPLALPHALIGQLGRTHETFTSEVARLLRGLYPRPMTTPHGASMSLGLFDEAQFERGLQLDIEGARQSIVIFSAFITMMRARSLSKLLEPKIAQGVKVRCVTRPPRSNGNIPEAIGREAIACLESIGATLDCRAKIHQKAVLIDGRIVWFGSINALSHMYMADETMSRVIDEDFASMLAAHMCRRNSCPQRALDVIAEQENPPCTSCRGSTILTGGPAGISFICAHGC